GMDPFYNDRDSLAANLKQRHISLLDFTGTLFFCRWTNASGVNIQIVTGSLKLNRGSNMGMAGYKDHISNFIKYPLEPLILLCGHIRRHILLSLGIMSNKGRMTHHNVITT